MGEVVVGDLDGGEVVEERVEGRLLGGVLFWGGFACWGGTRAVHKKAAAQGRNELDGQNLWAGQISGGSGGLGGVRLQEETQPDRRRAAAVRRACSPGARGCCLAVLGVTWW